MTWVRIDDDINEHPKVAALDDHGFALFVAGLAYCNRNLTDGFIPNAVGHGQLRWSEGNTTPAIRQLEEEGLWEPVNGGWHVHDFHDYQPSRAQVEAEREANRARKEKSRRKSQGESQPDSRRDHGGSHGPVTSLPVPVPGSEPETKPQGLKIISPNDAAFEMFWKIYPRREGKRAARAAFEKALKRASADVITAGAKRYDEDPNRSEEFTAHPSTWLNRDGWEDEPLPAKGSGNKPLADRMMATALSMGGGGDDRPGSDRVGSEARRSFPS